MKQLKNVVAILLLACVVVVVLQNTAEVETHILFATVILPRALLLLITLLIGVGVGMLLATRGARKSG